MPPLQDGWLVGARPWPTDRRGSGLGSAVLDRRWLGIRQVVAGPCRSPQRSLLESDCRWPWSPWDGHRRAREARHIPGTEHGKTAVRGVSPERTEVLEVIPGTSKMPVPFRVSERDLQRQLIWQPDRDSDGAVLRGALRRPPRAQLWPFRRPSARTPAETGPGLALGATAAVL